MHNSPVFRVFISSTFGGLHEAQDILQRQVFPNLKKHCEQRGCVFQPIDLRWGVYESEAVAQRTMQVWLDQIEWCQETTVRPNFIVILGDRYGWQPIPDSIEASEYEQLAETLSAEDIAFLTRVGDQQTGWYQLDNNSIPASYSRLNAAGERPTNDEWSTIESQIRHLFRRAADAAYGKRR